MLPGDVGSGAGQPEAPLAFDLDGVVRGVRRDVVLDPELVARTVDGRPSDMREARGRQEEAHAEDQPGRLMAAHVVAADAQTRGVIEQPLFGTPLDGVGDGGLEGIDTAPYGDPVPGSHGAVDLHLGHPRGERLIAPDQAALGMKMTEDDGVHVTDDPGAR